MLNIIWEREKILFAIEEFEVKKHLEFKILFILKWYKTSLFYGFSIFLLKSVHKSRLAVSFLYEIRHIHKLLFHKHFKFNYGFVSNRVGIDLKDRKQVFCMKLGFWLNKIWKIGTRLSCHIVKLYHKPKLRKYRVKTMGDTLEWINWENARIPRSL